MEAPPLNPGGYFRCASRFWMGVIAVSIGYFAWTVFLPSTIPYENLGQLGHVTKYLVDRHPKLLYNGFWLAWGIHIAEALYSIKLCKTKGITDSSVQRRWFIQTFLFESCNTEAGFGDEEDDEEIEDSSQQGSGETGFPNSQDMFLTLDLQPVTLNPPKACAQTLKAQKGLLLQMFLLHRG
ncbi:transmembrane protein 254 isoform X1 [Gopherus flavomarginatus]|uniref:transmembrane protein 254 isoform X1 n=1 Tax=Gopherus flavomarginatus TaxID=286002 RepID=UPI0021CC0BD7|nr:transmembrane protein 254 isoform X1 [Gopherus flavomarginatus]